MSMIDGISQLLFNVYEAFTVALYVRDNDRLNCLSSVTFAKSFDKDRSIPIEGTLPGWVIKHNEPLIIPNFDKDEDTLGYYGASEGIKSFMGYPVDADGVIIVDSKKKYVFTDREKKILGFFVSVIREEIERINKARDVEEAIEDFYAEKRIMGLFNELNLGKISVDEILKEVLSLSGGDFCFIGVEKNGRLSITDVYGVERPDELKRDCQPGASIASMVMEGGRELLLPYNSGYLREKPLFFFNEPIKARQFFGFPLATDDMILGVLGFVSLIDVKLKEQFIGVLRNVSTFLSLYYSSHWMKEHINRLKDFEPVTGAIQFSSFLGIVDKMIKKNEKFSLLTVKVLHIKTYNRRMGYEFTHNLLKRLFQVIRYSAGAQAHISRKGGSRFYIAVKGNDMVETRNMIKLIQYTAQKILSEERVFDRGDLIECGMCLFPEDSKDLWELFEKADEKKHRKIIE